VSDSAQPTWHIIVAGLCASLVGIGLARFAYSPLLPALIQAHWFPATAAVYLGASNLTGYLLGALSGRAIGARLSNVRSLRLMQVLVTLSLLACAFPLSIAWYFVWRLLSGIAGGVIMVLVAATVLPHVSEKHKGIASGAVFLGVGLGIAASGTVVPLLLRQGVAQTWLGLAALSAILTAVTWSWWPSRAAVDARSQTLRDSGALPAPAHTAIGILYAAYGLMALGQLPAMMFLVEFVARDLGAGAHVASLFWIIYGIGSIFGPPSYGLLADRLGAGVALRWVLVVQVFAIAGFIVSSNLVAAGALAFVIGSFPPGVVPLVMAWVRETLPNFVAAQNVIWGRATTVFAACQACGAYGYSALYNVATGGHRSVFAISAWALAIAFVINLITAPAMRAARQHCRMASGHS
jgi:predicted MFS family arabinose efflux permease